MKKLFILSVFLCFSASLFLNSCDKIDPPYKESEPQEQDTTPKRNFLLEEFTGHTCPNCPPGAIVAQQLKNLYGERLVIISIHYEFFAEPGASPFDYDFRSATGTEIGDFFSLGDFPSGMISRNGWTQAQNNADIGINAWGTRIETIKNDEPLLSIEITTDYDTTTRITDATIECDALTDFSGTYKIAAYITEDSIVQAQKTENDVNHPDNIIYDYVHRHVLRGSMNGTWGDTLVSGNVVKGQGFVKNYSSVLNSAWNAKQCYVVVFVYDASNYEIMQVEEKKIY